MSDFELQLTHAIYPGRWLISLGRSFVFSSESRYFAHVFCQLFLSIWSLLEDKFINILIKIRASAGANVVLS